MKPLRHVIDGYVTRGPAEPYFVGGNDENIPRNSRSLLFVTTGGTKPNNKKSSVLRTTCQTGMLKQGNTSVRYIISVLEGHTNRDRKGPRPTGHNYQKFL
jgi:hypothetical protein